MSLLKFNYNESTYNAGIRRIGHRIEIKFNAPVNNFPTLIVDGFKELNENTQAEMSDFSEYKYIYQTIEEGTLYLVSNEDESWIPPEPTPPPAPPEPSLDEVKAYKIAEMEEDMAEAIKKGMSVELSDGTIGTFELSTANQVSLTNLRLMAEKAEPKDVPSIPWHISDESLHCVFFSPNDIIKITNAAMNFTTYHVTFFRDLRIYINSLETKEEVEAIIYDISSLPEEYWSDVLKSILNVGEG